METYFTAPAHFDKEAKKVFLEQRTEIEADIAETIAEEAIFDDVLWPFLKKVHNRIAAANPDTAPSSVILSGNPVPNAFSIGDGTLVVYTGLLSELENEDQVAFVICHEMAHFVLRHAPKQLVRNIERFHSKEFKEQLKKIEQSEFNQSEMLEEMLMTVEFKSRYHHRDLERQADSLAYGLFLNAGYDPAQAVRLMALFENIDQPLRDSSLALDRHFGCAAYPFQAKWTGKGSASIWGSAIAAQEEENKVLSDSMSTHPDSKLRLRWLQEMMLQLESTIRTPVTEHYEEVRFLSALENVHTAFSAERYDRAIYLSVLYLKKYPGCAFFQDILSLSLNGMYFHMKRHNLSEVVSQSSPYYSERYNDLLTFLNNLRLSELLELQVCSMQGQKDRENEYALYAAFGFAVAKEDLAKAKEIKNRYLQLYPKGRFAEVLKEL